MSVTEGFEPYAWRLVVTGMHGQDGIPYGSVECGPDAYQNISVRAAIEENARQTFAHQHPGVAIASVRWYPLHDFGSGDDE